MPRIRSFARTTAFRLSLLFALLYGSCVAVLLGGVSWSILRYVDGAVRDELNAELDVYRAIYRDLGADGLRSALKHVHDGRSVTGRTLALLDGEGRLVLGSLPVELPAGLERNSVQSVAGNEYLLITGSLADGSLLAIAQGPDGIRGLHRYIQELARYVLPLGLLIAVLLGLVLGKRNSRRVETIARTADEIMAGDLTRRLEISNHHDEIDAVALRLNRILDRLEALMSGMRRFSDNVAHDLRTPLTRMRNRVEVMLLEERTPSEYRTVLVQTSDEAERLIGTFNALLSISRAEAGVQSDHWAPLELGPPACELAEFYDALAEERELTLRCEAGDDDCPPVIGDRHLLAQAIGNLLDNALKFTPRGGSVALSVHMRFGQPTLEVADTGPGIPPKERQRVLERFERLEASRDVPGNGLGLALVRAVAQLHGAQLELDDNRPGLIVRLRFAAE